MDQSSGGRFWKWIRLWGKVLGEDQRTKFKVWCRKWEQVFKAVKQTIKKDAWPRIILFIPSVNWTIVFASMPLPPFHTHKLFKVRANCPIVSPLSKWVLRTHVFSKFDMETRLSIHLTFAEIHYRTGSDIYRSYCHCSSSVMNIMNHCL